MEGKGAGEIRTQAILKLCQACGLPDLTIQARLSQDGKGWQGRIWTQKTSHDLTTVDQPVDLNPEWIEWLMGFPTGWTNLED
jgi:hypothetical protein